MNKLLRFSSLLVALAVVSFTVSAAIPSGYYDGMVGKTTADLKTAARNIIYNHTELSYSGLKYTFEETDVYPNSTRWWDMYSNTARYTTNGFTGLNREHSLPKSWWGGSSSTPAYCDINHLYPSDIEANSAKSNHPLGEVLNAKFDNGLVKVGTPLGTSGGASQVFEPADEYKGDMARAYFYMVTCYQDLNWVERYMWMLQNNTYPTLAPWAQEMLLRWSREDPVSQKELDRNEAVYTLQGNRNPFIDFPQLAEYIWGNKMGEKFTFEGGGSDGGGGDTPPQGTDPVLITPTQGMSLDFGEVALGKEGVAKLHFRGENLTGSLELVISRNDASMFTLSDFSIKTEYVNTEDGYWTTITYKPTSVGTHTSKLFISDGGISGSRGVELKGTCLEMPKLSTPVALPATNVTSTSYTANWEVPADEVDYYVVTRIRYENGETVVEEITADENFLEIDNMSGTESYSVQSVRLEVRSASSNVIMVEPAGVNGVESDLPAFGTKNHPGGVMFICGEPVQNVSIYDSCGRLVRELREINDGDVVSLPFGCYIIQAPKQRKPFRVFVTE